MSESTMLLLRSESETTPPVGVDVETKFQYEIELLNEFANNVTHDARSKNHPIRVAAFASDFSNGRFNNEFYSCTLLHDVIQAALPELNHNSADDTRLYSKNAARLLENISNTDYAREFLPEAGMSRWDYMLSVASHFNIVEDFAEENRQNPAGKSKELHEVLQGHGIGNVTKDLWLEPAALTRPVSMVKLLGHVSQGGEEAELEAVIIKAAEKLDSLFHPTENEQSLLRNIHDAESFYAPICELIGQDGLASALRSKAAIIRLEKSGNVAFVEKAAEILKSLGDKNEVLKAVEGLLGKLAIGQVEVDKAFKDTTGHGITLGTAEIEIHSNVHEKGLQEARAIWRIKSLGSLAMKLFGDNKELKGKTFEDQKEALKNITLPSDILALTIVTPEADIASVFARAAVTVYDDKDIKLTGTPNKKEPYVIKGGTDFKQKLVGAITLEPGNYKDDSQKITKNDIMIPKKETKMEVAKFTVEFEGKKMEVQYMTPEMRIQTRIGLAAHILYKLNEQKKLSGEIPDDEDIEAIPPEEIAAMEEIHDRAIFLGSYTLMNTNHSRTKALKDKIRKASPLYRRFLSFK